MKAAVYEDIQVMKIRNKQIPEIDPDGMLISIEASAICGSDVRTYWHGNAHTKPPRIIGHEMGGAIVKIGANVTGYMIGEKVIVAPAIGCGTCVYCRRGESNICENLKSIGFEYDGGFAEMIAIPGKAVLQGHVNKIPVGFPVEQAILAEPLACCINGQSHLDIKLGDTVVIIGAGVIGSFHAELALLKGAKQVIVADVLNERLKQIENLHKDIITLNSNECDLLKKVFDLTDGYGADVVIVACQVGAAQSQALQLVRKRGRISLFGGLPPEKSIGFIDSNIIHYKEAGVFGSHGSTAAQNRLALSLLTRQQINAAHYITHHIRLEEICKGLELAKEGKGLKIIITPN